MPGVTVTATNQATNVDYTAISNEAGNYTITSVPVGTYVVKAELTGFKTAATRADPARGEAGRAPRLQAGGRARSRTRSRSRRRRRSCRPRRRPSARSSRATRVQSLPLNGRNTGQLALLLPGHHHLQPARLHQHRQRQHEPAVRQRQPRADQQLHGRRPRRQRDDRQPRRLPAEPRRARRDQRRDQQLRGRHRQRRRRGDQQRHQVGREPVPRQRVRVLPQQRLRREHLGEQPLGRGQAGAQAAHLRRHARRPASSRTSCSSSATTRARARTRRASAPRRWRPRRGAAATCRAWRRRSAIRSPACRFPATRSRSAGSARRPARS